MEQDPSTEVAYDVFVAKLVKNPVDILHSLDGRKIDLVFERN